MNNMKNMYTMLLLYTHIMYTMLSLYTHIMCTMLSLVHKNSTSSYV